MTYVNLLGEALFLALFGLFAVGSTSLPCRLLWWLGSLVAAASLVVDLQKWWGS